MDCFAPGMGCGIRGGRRDDGERGSLLVWAAFVMLVILGLVATGVQNEAAHDKFARTELASEGQARAVADAGVVDAFAWFRRQQVQPVTNFAPRRDLAAVPAVNETDDPTVGLVREYEILPSLWGRYEVRLTRAPEPFVDADGDGRHDAGESFTDTDGNGSWDDAGGTRDVSLERGLPGQGAVWLIESRGLLFDRPRQDLPLGTPPNDVRASARVSSEVRRLTIIPPASAALCAAAGSSVSIGSRGRIRGGTNAAGIAYPQSSGTPSLFAGSEVTGTPASSPVPDYVGTLEAIFGVGEAELRSMADISTTDPEAVPSPLPSHALIVFEGDMTFDADRPLRGTGVVVVLGNCTVSAGSNSWFSGLLWVGGTLTVRAPCYLRGVLISEGSADVRGTGGDLAEIEHDDGIISELLSLMGQYRHSKTLYVPGAGSAGE